MNNMTSRIIRFIRNRLPFLQPTLGSPTITVTAPDGGETWYIGESQAVTWNYVDVSGAAVLYYNKSGGADIKIDDVADVTTGTYNWTIPNDASAAVRVKIVCGSASDQSDAVFTIATPSITLTEPDGGESLTSGSSFNIEWSSTGITGNVTLAYSTDNGANYTDITTVAYNSSPYAWTVPVAISTTCLVKIEQGAISDQSAATFTIGFGAAVAFYIDSNAGAPRWNDACGGISSANVSYTNDSGTDKSSKHTLSNDSHGSNNADLITSDSWNTVMRILNANMGALKGTSGTSFTIIIKWKTDATPNGYLQFTVSNADTEGYIIQAHPGPQEWIKVSTGAWSVTKVITTALSASTWYFGIFSFNQDTNKIWVELYDVTGSELGTGNGVSYGGNYNPSTSNWRYRPKNNAVTISHYVHFNKFASDTDIANTIAWCNTV